MSPINYKMTYYTTVSNSLSNYYSLPNTPEILPFKNEIINFIIKNYKQQKTNVDCSLISDDTVLECKKINLDQAIDTDKAKHHFNDYNYLKSVDHSLCYKRSQKNKLTNVCFVEGIYSLDEIYEFAELDQSQSISGFFNMIPKIKHKILFLDEYHKSNQDESCIIEVIIENDESKKFISPFLKKLKSAEELMIKTDEFILPLNMIDNKIKVIRFYKDKILEEMTNNLYLNNLNSINMSVMQGYMKVSFMTKIENDRITYKFIKPLASSGFAGFADRVVSPFEKCLGISKRTMIFNIYKHDILDTITTESKLYIRNWLSSNNYVATTNELPFNRLRDLLKSKNKSTDINLPQENDCSDYSFFYPFYIDSNQGKTILKNLPKYYNDGRYRDIAWIQYFRKGISDTINRDWEEYELINENNAALYGFSKVHNQIVRTDDKVIYGYSVWMQLNLLISKEERENVCKKHNLLTKIKMR